MNGNPTAYDFDRVIDRQGTSSLKWDFGEKFAGMSGLVPLWVADMDFEAPAEIVQALQARVAHGIFGYTLEPESYFDAAAGWLRRRHGWEVRREWMLPSPGVIPALVFAILALTKPGEGIVIQPPVYYPFPLRVSANGRRVVENPLKLSGGRWEMDLDGLARVVDEHTKMLILCSPHNPACRVWGRATLQALADFCLRKGIVVVSDEIHNDLVMPGSRHIPFASLSNAAAAHTVTLVSATKSFNLAGLGGSLTLIPEAGLRARFDAVQHAIAGGPANAIAAAAAEAAWRHGERWLEELLAYVQANYRFLAGFLAENIPMVTLAPLEGTYLAWMDMRALMLSDDQIREKLRREAGLWLDEGRKFGRGGEGFQRLNLACPRAILSDAAERLARAFRGG
ncbi:MAG: MalY/PatB family protein [Spirochaetia bacterium]